MGLTINRVIDGYRFQSITESDKDCFMSLRCEVSDIAAAYKKMEGFTDYAWEQTLNDPNELSMIVFRECDAQFLATCSFQNMNDDPIELGYDVVAEYRGKGIGTAIAAGLIKLAHATFPDKRIIIRIRAENIASQKVAEKCGGRYIGDADTPEAMYFQIFLSKHPDLVSESKDMEDAINRGRNNVRIYEV